MKDPAPNDRTQRRRSYSSEVREAQRLATRRRILEAVAAIVLEGGIHTFSVRDVAERSGVSYPSVYRHFPNRERLVEAAYEWAEAAARDAMPPPPPRLEDVGAWIARALPALEQHRQLSAALVVMTEALGVRPPGQRRRDELVEGLVRERAPELPEPVARHRAAVIRSLAGAHGWATLRQRFGLGPEETAAALAWALHALVEAIDDQPPAGPPAAKGGR